MTPRESPHTMDESYLGHCLNPQNQINSWLKRRHLSQLTALQVHTAIILQRFYYFETLFLLTMIFIQNLTYCSDSCIRTGDLRCSLHSTNTPLSPQQIPPPARLIFASLPLKGCPKPAKFPPDAFSSEHPAVHPHKAWPLRVWRGRAAGMLNGTSANFVCGPAAPCKSRPEIRLACGSDSAARGDSEREQGFQWEKGGGEKRERKNPARLG